jgi:eukaryotic-like serine/threonine-protein kinase
MTIDPKSWATISKLLDEMLEIPRESRADWLQSLGPEHADFLPTLREMIAAEASLGPDSFLNTLPHLNTETQLDPPFHPHSVSGSSIGPYRLLRELGQGGMGTVWLAERPESEIKRPVALKLPILSLHNSSVAERFGRERDILAQLTHPNIARLYDAGVTDQGQPYLALEYVEGEKFTTYCDHRTLDLKSRLGLFLQVLRAVQYAHTNLIVHRDLTPANMLVTNEGEVRLLDFGIAKLLTEGEAHETELTRIGGRALTLDYASPEQIAGETITTASDVYSLGVIFFELLTGERPYKLKRGTRSAIEEAILAADPARPSQIAVDDAQAAARSSTPGKLSRALHGDLDSIALKALQKQPGARYATADAFAQDIERYLAGEAVLAQPESALYRARKFVRRNKLSVGLVAAVVVSLSIGLSVALWQAHVARIQTRTAQAVQNFLLDIFRANSSAHPDPLKARQTTARDLLDAGAKQIDSALSDAPQAKLDVFETMFFLYNDLGLKEQGVQLAKKRVALARSVYGPNHPEVARALVDLALNIGESSSVNDRPALLKEAGSILDRNRDFKSETRAGYYFAMASVLVHVDLDRSADYARQAIQLYRAYPPSNEMAAALNALGQVEVDRGHYREGIAALSEAVGIITSLQGESRHSLPALYAYLAENQYFLFDFPAAEQNYRLSLATARSLKGEEHEDVIQTKYRLGSFLVLTSRPQEGLKLGQEAVELALRTKGPEEVFHTPMVRDGYGSGLIRYGRVEEGLIPISQALEVRRRAKRVQIRDFASFLDEMAIGETELGHYQQATALLDEGFAIHTAVGDAAPSARLSDAIMARSRLLVATGHVEDARATLESIPKPSGLSTFAALDRTLAESEIALADGRTDEAIQYAGEMRRWLEASSMRSYFKRYEAPAALDEGKGLLLAGRTPEALPLLQRAVQLGSQIYDPDQSPQLADSQIALGTCLVNLGRRDEARALLTRAKAIHATHPDLGEQFKKPLRELELRLAVKP